MSKRFALIAIDGILKIIMLTNVKKFTIPFLVLLLVGMTGVAFLFYQKAVTLKKDPQATAKQEVEALVARMGKLIILPEGEVPTLATVSDPEKLKGQDFFAKAKVGDKALIYQNARKAYLYDPIANKILEVAPITLGAGTIPETKVSSVEKTQTKK